MTVRVLFVLVVFSFSFGSLRADGVLLGVGSIPGDASDLSGLSGKQSDGTPHNRLGGHGSAIASTAIRDEYLLASDRGPKDGATDFACRMHRMQIRVVPGQNPSVSVKLLATTLLTNEHGKPFVGSLEAFEHHKPEKNLRLDPEGIRVGPQGQIYISDEYGPVLYEFDIRGTRQRTFPVPDRFQAVKPGKSPAEELPPNSKFGRQPNRGMEGLAIAPDGMRLIGAMQSPLIQDGGLNEKNERVGLNCRLLELEVSSGMTREFVYPLDDPANGISEILAVNDREFLVLERDSKAGLEAKCKKVFLIDLKAATDVSSVESLPSRDLPSKITPVRKRLFIDLLAPVHRIAGMNCPEKFEGLAFGPDLPDGRRLLLITADNDFIVTVPFRVFAFAFGRSDLPNLRLQKFDSK